MLYGYAGKMLFVNLSTREIETRELKEEDVKNFLGGYGLGAKVLYEEMPADCDPFGEESMLGIVTGPFNGTGAFFGSRYMVVSKSPVTGGWNDANSGGYFSPKLKAAGYDAVFVKGIAKDPVYIFIEDGKAEIRDAKNLWGLNSKAFDEAIEKECGKDVKAAYISRAGENMSLFAAVMNDNHRAAGRGGSGAVMGSKKLKAIVAKGSLQTQAFDKAKVLELNKTISEFLNNGDGRRVKEGFAVNGTGGGYVASVMTNDAAIKNWSGYAEADYPEDVAYNVSSQGMDAKYKKKSYNCAVCPIGCGAIYDVKDGPWQLTDTVRPEYETQGAFGSQMANSNAESVIMCNELCNEYGFDTISMGATVAWAMECYEKGLFSKEELDGIELTWGNGEAIVAMTELICKNEGVGKILALGSKAAADHFKKGHEYLAVANGIEEPQHDSRLSFNHARTYRFDPTPGRHVKGGMNLRHSVEKPDNFDGTGYNDMLGVSTIEVMNCTGICLFGHWMCKPTPRIYFDMINAITGFNYSPADFVALGMRIFNMRAAFNVREGFRRDDYVLSERLYKSDPPFEGPIAGVVVDVDKLADNFFNAIGWDLNAVPQKAMLEQLGGLDMVIKDVYPPAE